MLRSQPGGDGMIKRPGAYDLFPPPKVSSWLDDLQSKIQRGLNPPDSPGPSRSPSPIYVQENEKIEDVFEGVGEIVEEQGDEGNGKEDDLQYDDVDEVEEEDSQRQEQLESYDDEYQHDDEEEEDEEQEGDRQHQVRVPLPPKPIVLLDDDDDIDDEEEEEEEEEEDDDDDDDDDDDAESEGAEPIRYQQTATESEGDELEGYNEDSLFDDRQDDYEPGYGVVAEEDGQAYVGSDGDVYAEEEDEVFDDEDDEDQGDESEEAAQEQNEDDEAQQEQSDDGIEYVGASESSNRSSQPPPSESIYPPLPQPSPLHAAINFDFAANDVPNPQIQPFSEDFIDPTLLADLVQQVHQGVPPQAAGPSTYAQAMPTEEVLQHQGGQYEDGAFEEDELDEDERYDQKGYDDDDDDDEEEKEEEEEEEEEEREEDGYELADGSEGSYSDQADMAPMGARKPIISNEVIEIGSSSEEDGDEDEDDEENRDGEDEGDGEKSEVDDEPGVGKRHSVVRDVTEIDKTDASDEDELEEEREEVEEGYDSDGEEEEEAEEEEAEQIELREAEHSPSLEPVEMDGLQDRQELTTEIQVNLGQRQEIEPLLGLDEPMQIDNIEIVELTEREETETTAMDDVRMATSIETPAGGVVDEIQEFISQLVEQQVEEYAQQTTDNALAQSVLQSMDSQAEQPNDALYETTLEHNTDRSIEETDIVGEAHSQPLETGADQEVSAVPSASPREISMVPSPQELAFQETTSDIPQQIDGNSNEKSAPAVADSFTLDVEDNAEITKNDRDGLVIGTPDQDIELVTSGPAPASASRESEEPTPSPIMRPGDKGSPEPFDGEDYVAFDALEAPQPSSRDEPAISDSNAALEGASDSAHTLSSMTAVDLPQVDALDSVDVGTSKSAGAISLEAPVDDLPDPRLSAPDTQNITPVIPHLILEQSDISPSLIVEPPMEGGVGDLSPASFSPLQNPASLPDLQHSVFEPDLSLNSPDLEPNNEDPLSSPVVVNKGLLSHDIPSVVISRPNTPPSLPDPYLPPPNTSDEQPIDPHDLEPKVIISPSLVVEAPSHPLPQDVPLSMPSRPETPTEFPDPRLSVPDTETISPLDPCDLEPREVTSPSLIVEPPADPRPTGPLSAPISRAETPVELPDPALPPIDAFLEPPITPYALQPISEPQTPSLEVEPPMETPAMSRLPSSLTVAGNSHGLTVIDDDVEEEAPVEDVPMSVEYGVEAAEAAITQDVPGEIDREESAAPTEAVPENSEIEEAVPQAESFDEHVPTRPALQMSDSAIERLRHHHGSPGANSAPVAAALHRRTRSRTRTSASPAPQPPVTRSHCFYEKLRISDDELTAVILAPHCTLLNTEQMGEEDARVEGVPTAGEEIEARQQMISHDNPILQPRLATKLRRIVGAQIFDERCCYVLYARADAKLPPPGTPQATGHRKRKSMSVAAEAEEEDEITVDVRTPEHKRTSPPAHATRSAARKSTASMEPEPSPARKKRGTSTARKGKARESSLASDLGDRRSTTGSPGPMLRRSARKSTVKKEDTTETTNVVLEEDESPATLSAADDGASLRTPRRSARRSLAPVTPEAVSPEIGKSAQFTPRRATRQPTVKAEDEREATPKEQSIPTPASTTRFRARKSLNISSKQDEAPYRPDEDEEGTPSPVVSTSREAPTSSRKGKSPSATPEGGNEDIEMEEESQGPSARSTRRKRKTNDEMTQETEAGADTLNVRETRAMKRRAVEDKDQPGTPVREEQEPSVEVENAGGNDEPAEEGGTGGTEPRADLRRTDSWGGRFLRRLRFGR
ncbi:hypothetical protein IAR55_007086 [Kwoniella newhampshirensis]|uniref:BRCT domain-containing protein n=1 Tax=Kwoniella newhampshirensis TaxID=1651941 RepID=A0AAW0YHQ2_9TREE